jgi:Flp pilus assembly protein TadD
MTALAYTHQSSSDTINEAMTHAIANHRAGRLHEATELYQAVLAANPRHPDASHNLGVLYIRANDFEKGLERLITAVDIEPTVSQYWLSYIEALVLAGREEDARQVIALAQRQGLQGKRVSELALQLNAHN